jgi:hypothetical protein
MARQQVAQRDQGSMNSAERWFTVLFNYREKGQFIMGHDL